MFGMFDEIMSSTPKEFQHSINEEHDGRQCERTVLLEHARPNIQLKLKSCNWQSVVMMHVSKLSITYI